MALMQMPRLRPISSMKLDANLQMLTNFAGRGRWPKKIGIKRIRCATWRAVLPRRQFLVPVFPVMCAR